MRPDKLDRSASIPASIGAYRIVGTLGQGGMGVVYDAVHGQSGRRVALKTVNALSRKLLTALRTEVLALRGVEHPYVVAIVDEGLSEVVPWYAMERIEGRPLSEFNRALWGTTEGPRFQSSTAPGSVNEPTPISRGLNLSTRGEQVFASANKPPVAAGKLDDALAVYRLLCEPLMHVHALGIVHRDLKPSNVILRSDGTPVLMDFGLASRAFGIGGRDALDLASRFVGSAPYVPPEQIRGEFVDARADLYSLGCVMYETLTGRPPFLGGSTQEVLEKHLQATPLAPSALVQGVPPAIDDLLLRLLAKRPQDRIGHADDVLAALLEVGSDQGRRSSVYRKGAAPSYLYRPALAERTDAIEQIAGLCDDASNGHGRLAFIGGESGIGKTFLAAEAGRRAAMRKFQVVTGECAPLGTDDGAGDVHAGHFHPFRRLFQAIADRCREGGEEVTAQLLGGRAEFLAPFEPSLLRLPGQAARSEAAVLPPEAAQRRVVSALATTLQKLALEAPLLLILDDLHWADELTRTFLESLTPEFFEGNRIVILGLYRFEEANESLRQLLQRPSVHRLTLDRLPPSAVAAMVGDMLAMPNPPEGLIRFVARQSEGNPFFAAEYLRLLAAEHIVQRQGGAWMLSDQTAGDDAAFDRLELPRSIKDIVGRRLAGLGANERLIVECAAVLGRVFDDETLAMVAKTDERSLAAAVRELTARQVLEEVTPGSHRFAHDKLRSAALSEIPPERRRALHAACGRALEARTPEGATQPFAELAYHFGQANQRAEATTYLEKAAEQALSQFANREAAQYYRELLAQDHPGDGPESALRRARWERGLGDALHGMGQHDAQTGVEEDTSRAHLEKALLLLGHPMPPSKGRLAASLIGQLSRQIGHRLIGIELAAEQDSERLRNREASQAYDRLLQIFYYKGLQLEMLYATFKTLNLAELAGPSPELAMAYSIAHAVAGIIPLRSMADAYLERANEVLEKTPDPSVDSYLQLLAGVYRSGTTEWEKARAALDRGLTLATSLSFDRRCDELNLGLANWSFLQGRFAEAMSHAEALLLSFGRGDPQAQAWQLLMHAQVDLVHGRVTEALELGQRAERLAVDEKTGLATKLQRSELIWTFAVLATARLRSGAFDEARTHAEAALEQILAGPPSTFYCIEGYASVCEVFFALWERAASGQNLAEGIAENARKACSALRAFARVFPAAKPRSLLYLGVLAKLEGAPAKAKTLFTRSAEAAKTQSMPYDGLLAAWALARGLATTDPTRASELARIARVAEELGAEYLAARAHADVEATHP